MRKRTDLMPKCFGSVTATTASSPFSQSQGKMNRRPFWPNFRPCPHQNVFSARRWCATTLPSQPQWRAVDPSRPRRPSTHRRVTRLRESTVMRRWVRSRNSSRIGAQLGRHARQWVTFRNDDRAALLGYFAPGIFTATPFGDAASRAASAGHARGSTSVSRRDRSADAAERPIRPTPSTCKRHGLELDSGDSLQEPLGHAQVLCEGMRGERIPGSPSPGAAPYFRA